MMLCQDEDSLLQEIDTAPEDSERRLVYADWLDERGDQRSRFVRLEVELERSTRSGDSEKLGSKITRLRHAGDGLDKRWKRRLMRDRTTEILVALDSRRDPGSSR